VCALVANDGTTRVGPTSTCQHKVTSLRQVSQLASVERYLSCQRRVVTCEKRSRLVQRPYLTLFPKLRFQSTATLARLQLECVTLGRNTLVDCHLFKFDLVPCPKYVTHERMRYCLQCGLLIGRKSSPYGHWSTPDSRVTRLVKPPIITIDRR
jgi:hypothetical protein